MSSEEKLPIYAIYKYVTSQEQVRIILGHKKYQLRGKLAGFDEFFNLVITNAEQIQPDGAIVPLGRLVLKGENVAMVRSEK